MTNYFKEQQELEKKLGFKIEYNNDVYHSDDEEKGENKKEYSNETLRLDNGTSVFVKTIYEKNWNKIITFKGIIRKFKTNINQYGFDKDLSDFVKNNNHLLN